MFLHAHRITYARLIESLCIKIELFEWEDATGMLDFGASLLTLPGWVAQITRSLPGPPAPAKKSLLAQESMYAG